MPRHKNPLSIGKIPLKNAPQEVTGGYVDLSGERFYRIRNFDAMEPFFISIVSSSDHWLFISSSGGITAGRVNAEQALFPYYTVDRLTENSENTGAKAILRVEQAETWQLWEPFSPRQDGLYRLERSLYKNEPGTALIFEEINLDLELTYRYAWRTSQAYGFIKSAWLANRGAAPCRVELLDGLQNLLAPNISSLMQNEMSVLLDAYKRGELDPASGLGIFALNSNPTDLAEPSECLRATTVAQLGLQPDAWLLSTRQLAAFRRGAPLETEFEQRGQRGAYFVHAALELPPGAQRSWSLVAEVSQDYAAVLGLARRLQSDPAGLSQAIEADIAASQQTLVKIIAGADGLQCTNLPLNTAHHFANVLFNVLRGGSFANQYWIQAGDLRQFTGVHAPALLVEQAGFFASLPQTLLATELQARAARSGSADLARLCASYLPLTFSRRHGDPSRPWNRFSINIRNPDGSLRLDYEGNWRDIFQNWEALAWSYPEFVEGMLYTFLNATTVDGYNPYRITRSGVDWEEPSPHLPWANIGYWSDHQIIYLLKLMEISLRFHPGRLEQDLARPVFSYANVPYRIKPYHDLLQDPYDTITFDWELQRAIQARLAQQGTDARLVCASDGRVLHASLTEKLLTLLLAKLANFVPEGGIWMNTQRPEWNDANNALVGKGLSVVTLGYLRRYLAFCAGLFGACEQDLPVRQEVAAFYQQVAAILARFEPLLAGSFSASQRREMLDLLGQAGSDYRWDFYRNGASGAISALPARQIAQFCELALKYVDHSLRANQRPDRLYHSYNILQLSPGQASFSHLHEMLEGQVSLLSSGMLSAQQALTLLESLRASALYRADQHTYILYPDRSLPGFLEKNCIPAGKAESLALVRALAAANDRSLVIRDLEGAYHFGGKIRNINDLNAALAALQAQPAFAGLVEAEGAALGALFEEVFHHQQFIGRSGAFFAYEGLGSIYWHMISKLLLAVQENLVWARQQAAGEALRRALAEKYVDIRLGLGFHKPPEVYGAFPTDPYSHTPKGQGAKQPGMTGQVKEEILTRWAELGLYVQEGRLVFEMELLDRAELLQQSTVFSWQDGAGQAQSLELNAGSLAYTFCQTPVVLQAAPTNKAAYGNRIEVFKADGSLETIAGHILDESNSRHIFQRDRQVHHLRVIFPLKD